MTTEQIKKSVFEQTQARGTDPVAQELGITPDALTSWLIAGRSVELKTVQKAAELYLEMAAVANRPNEVVMGRPEAPAAATEQTSVIPGANGFSAVQTAPTPREATQTSSGAPPIARNIAPVGAMVAEADPEPIAEPLPVPPAQSKSIKAKASTKKNLCLLFPIYKSVDPATFMTVLGFWDKATMYAELSPGDAMIARSRNRLAKRFLEGTAEWSLWLDDDLVFPCGSAGLYRYLVGAVDPFQKKQQQGHWANAIDDKFLNYSAPTRLMSHGKTLVAGTYYDRFGKNTITAVYSTGPQNRIPSDSLHPVDFAGTGLMLVHRSVYEDIAKKFPEISHEKGESQFFAPIQGKERMWGEDQSFCWRAKEAGHPTYLDLGCVAGHVGTMCFGVPSK